jgi:hypothetical protein
MLWGMDRSVLYVVLGNVCSGAGAPGRKPRALLDSTKESRSTNLIAIA